MNFEEMNISPQIVRALKEMNIVEPTTIQEKAIPLIREGRDLVGMSKTGSGKTAAFGIPLLEKIVPGQGIQALILAPVRELASQIAQELHKFGKYMRFNTATIFGGVSMGPQVHDLSRAEIVIATPGRLLDHIQRRTINLSKIKMVVLDEADKMVDMGFIDDVNRILNSTPRNKQMLLFGATIYNEIDQIKRRHMNNPAVAKAELQVIEDFLEQYYYDTEMNEKFSLLVHLLNKEETKKVIIFCSARSTVELVANNLRAQGIKAEKIHGQLSQNRRSQVIQDFNKGFPKVLVASAVASRGLDIKDVSHVFNYDLSPNPQEYIHRVGRTARAGETGKAITLLSQRDHPAFRSIIDRYRVEVKKLPPEQFPKIAFRTGFPRNRDDNSRRFGNGGRFPSRSNPRGGDFGRRRFGR